MEFVHGTSSIYLDDINEHGLLPPADTDHTSEKRTKRLDEVHILDAKYANFAAAYALRATLHWGGEPVVIFGEIPEVAIKNTLSGKGKFPEIYTVPYIPSVHIDHVEPVDSTADISTLFKSHKS